MTENKGRVLVAAPVHDVLISGLRRQGYTCEIHERITQDAARELIRGCAGVITSTRLQLDMQLLDAASGLRWIGRMGSGMEVIDVEYAAKQGIRVYASPEGNCNAVGEHALGMLLSLVRRIGWSSSEVARGAWNREENRGHEIEGSTVGIIGYGHTGRAFARKLSGFDVRIIAYDKYDPDSIEPSAAACDSLDRIYAEADIISFHVPLQPDTIHYFNEDFLAAMQKPFILVNTSRGAVADLLSVYNGLKNGAIRGVCLDVLEEEPPTKMEEGKYAMFDEMLHMPNVVVTPHIAGYTFEALYKMSKTLLDKITAGNF